MHQPGAGLRGDVLAQDHEARAEGQEGVLGLQHLELRARELLDGLAREAGLGEEAIGEVLGDHQVAVLVGAQQLVLEGGVEADGDVGRQRPGGGGPDDQVHGLVDLGELGDHSLRGHLERELDVDARAHVLVVLDLGLGQGGLAVRAPVDGLQATVDVALLGHLPEDLDLLGLVSRVHGQVGVLPVGHDAQSAELGLLAFEVGLGKSSALLAQLEGGHGVAAALDVLQDGVLDGQAVAVVARHERREGAVEVAELDHDVFERAVQRVPDVDVRRAQVGRAVVHDEGGGAGATLEHALINALLVPAGLELRLTLRRVRPHGELGGGQVHRALVVACGGLHALIRRIQLRVPFQERPLAIAGERPTLPMLLKDGRT
ncbi:hypothetical protein D3C72_667290 [compost metagenome]